MTQTGQTRESESRSCIWTPDASPLIAGVRRLAIFIAIVSLGAVLLHVLITSGLRRIDTSSFGVSNAIVDGAINADILILGSSRALAHYDPRIIEQVTGRRSFNIGLNGSQTDMQLARLKSYLRHNKPPSTLLFNLDTFSFQTTHGGVFDPAQYMPYINWEPDIYDALKRIDPSIWKSKFIPLYGYTVGDLRFEWMLGIASLFHWRPAEDHFLGFNPREKAWTDEFEQMRAMHPDGVHIDIEASGVEQMEEMLRLCRDRHIRVVLVYSPEYVEMQELTNNRSEVFNKFEELSRQFHVPLWDYSGSALSTDKAYFQNSQHLNAQGARKFSLEIAERTRGRSGHRGRQSVISPVKSASV